MELNKLKKIIERHRITALELHKAFGDLTRITEKYESAPDGSIPKVTFKNEAEKYKNAIVTKAAAEQALAQLIIDFLS